MQVQVTAVRFLETVSRNFLHRILVSETKKYTVFHGFHVYLVKRTLDFYSRRVGVPIIKPKALGAFEW